MSTSDNKQKNVYDVIIIGAGLSGLSSAFYLKEKCNDLKILIVEGKDRCGGRTNTVELNTNRKGKKAKWDAGGQWVTDSQKNVTKMLEKLNIQTYKQHTNGKKILEINEKLSTYNKSIPNISWLSLLDLSWLLTKFNMGAKRLNTIYPFENIHLATHLDSINLEQYMFSNSLSNTSQAIAECAIKTIYGLESNQLNALFALMYGKSAGSFERLALADKDCAQEKRIKGGAQQISERLLQFVLENKSNQVLFNSALIEVRQSELNEEELASIIIKNNLTEAREQFYAKRIISSIPLNQYSYVKFVPELPTYKSSLFNHCKFGNYTKFIITYEKAFWREKGYSGEVVSDGSVLTLNEEKFNQIYQAQASNLTFNKQMPSIGPITCMFDATTSDDEPALIGFMACRSAIEWADHSAQTRLDEIIECLVRYFGEEARDYVDFFEKNWNQEPFTGGCPTLNISAGSLMQDYARATREPFLQVHFCGTESATEWQGYMDGAIESGERAANEVLYSLYGNFTSIKIDYEKTFYFQKHYIESIKKRNNSNRLRISLSMLAKFFVYFTVFGVFSYTFFNLFLKR